MSTRNLFIYQENDRENEDETMEASHRLPVELNPLASIINNRQNRSWNRIALISVHGDPSVDIGKEEAGGQNVYVRQVGEHLAKLGWKVDMFTRKISEQQSKIVEHLPNCKTIRLTAGPEKHINRDNLFSYASDFLRSFLNYQQENQVFYPVVHTNYWISGWVGLALNKVQGSKQVHTHHSLGAVKYRNVNKIPSCANIRLEVERNIVETAAKVVATSPEEKKDMKELVSGKGDIIIIPCGTDTMRFGHIDRASARKELSIRQDAKIVLYVGRFDERKGIETLVNAVAISQYRNDDKFMLIIGGGSVPGQPDGKEKGRIIRIVDELNLKDVTHFTGQLGPNDLHLYYAAADICVVPSHYEPFGLVAIEAMASRTPVIASDVGGLRYTVVHDLTGLLVEVKNEVAFRDGIDKILSNPTLRDKFGKNGAQRVRSLFTWEKVTNQLTKLYLKI